MVHVVSNIIFAQKSEAAGVDAIVAEDLKPVGTTVEKKPQQSV